MTHFLPLPDALAKNATAHEKSIPDYVQVCGQFIPKIEHSRLVKKLTVDRFVPTTGTLCRIYAFITGQEPASVAGSRRIRITGDFLAVSHDGSAYIATSAILPDKIARQIVETWLDAGETLATAFDIIATSHAGGLRYFMDVLYARQIRPRDLLRESVEVFLSKAAQIPQDSAFN